VGTSFPGRAWRRRAWFGLRTVLGFEPRGFFLPYRYAATLPRPGARAPYETAEALFAGRREAFAEVLAGLAPLADDLARIGMDPPPEPRWGQSWFPRLDAAVAYGLVRREKPRRIVEIGSGHSTRFLARAVADGGLGTRITAVDPEPRAALETLPVEWRRQTVQAAGFAPFRDLAAGDFMSIDSSHILMPGSDVDFLFGRVLPALPAGVWLHVHDVFLPDDYPAEWDWRGYNEQLGVLALLNGGGWQVEFASHYVATRMADELDGSVVADLELPEGAFETSLWLTKSSNRR